MKSAPLVTGEAPDTQHQSKADAVAPVMNRAASRAKRLTTGETHKRTVLGREITFTLKRIPHAEIEERTQVWELNERDQELLTPAALADILPSLKEGGQEEPAYGRNLADGRYETADGSRRRKGCMLAGADYLIWLADLSDAEMEHISQLGNKYTPPSAYERGKRYQRLIDSKQYNGIKPLAAAEGVDRNIIRRCINTAQLPREIIKLYHTVNDISARAGDTLLKALCPEMLTLANNENFQAQAPTLPADQVTAALLDTCKPKAKEAPARTWSDDALRIDRNGGKGLKVEISDDVPEAVLVKIEKILRKELQIEAGSDADKT